MIFELEGTAILGDGTDYMVWNTEWDIRLDLQGDLDLGAHDPGEVRDNLVGNAAGVAADPRCFKRYAPMETLRWRRHYSNLGAGSAASRHRD